MYPVLFSVGPITISSFGFFLSLAFLLGAFLIWRLARGWELPEEKILDLILLTFFGGLIGSRIYFVLFNLSFFASDFYKAILITKYPGLSFWGGFLGGILTLVFFARRLGISFWQAADLGAIGLLGGLVLGDLGCLLSGCDIGSLSVGFGAVNFVGVIGSRFPVQLLEAVLVLLVLFRLWKQASRFHFHGKIFSLTLLWLGIIKLITQSFRDSTVSLANNFWLSLGFSGALIIAGIIFFYKTGKGNIRKDITDAGHDFSQVFVNSEVRSRRIERIRTNWYNQKVNLTRSFKKLAKLPRRLRVKPTPKDI